VVQVVHLAVLRGVDVGHPLRDGAVDRVHKHRVVHRRAVRLDALHVHLEDEVELLVAEQVGEGRVILHRHVRRVAAVLLSRAMLSASAMSISASVAAGKSVRARPLAA